MKSKDFYIIQTEEDREFEVVNSLKKLFKEDLFFIPLNKERLMKSGLTYSYYEKIMPDYIVWETETTDKKVLRVSGTEFVLSILSDYNSDSVIPSKVERQEIKKFLNSRKFNEEIARLELKKCILLNGNKEFIVNKVSGENVMVIYKNEEKQEYKIWELAFLVSEEL